MITLNLDPTNPSHTLACGGIFELLSARNPNVVASYWNNGEVFAIDGASFEDLDALIKDLCNAPVRYETMKTRSSEGSLPLVLDIPNGPVVRLDWYSTGQPQCKTWCGQVKPHKIVGDLQRAWADLGKTPTPNLFFDHGGHKAKRTRLDPRALVSKDSVGFSADEANLKLWIYYAAELFAFIGLQTFRPSILGRPTRDGSKMSYAMWEGMFPIELARYAYRGGLPEVISQRFAFVYEKELKAQLWFNFSYAWPL